MTAVGSRPFIGRALLRYYRLQLRWFLVVLGTLRIVPPSLATTSLRRLESPRPGRRGVTER
jgi:hypothetical protein